MVFPSQHSSQQLKTRPARLISARSANDGKNEDKVNTNDRTACQMRVNDG
jgi:hypothetical protein